MCQPGFHGLDGASDQELPGSTLANPKMHYWRTGVRRQNAAAVIVGDEGVNRSGRIPLAMGDMKDLQIEMGRTSCAAGWDKQDRRVAVPPSVRSGRNPELYQRVMNTVGFGELVPFGRKDPVVYVCPAAS